MDSEENRPVAATQDENETNGDAKEVVEIPVSGPEPSGDPAASAPPGASEEPYTKDSGDDSPETVHFLHGVLGLFTTPETGPESEEEVKIRRELNEVVHRMLIVGLALSTVVLFVGLALSAIFHQPAPSRVLGFRQVFEGLERGSPPSILSLGILLLIATPVLRVFGSLVEFVAKKDWRYAGITFLVLLILALSVLIGKG